MAHNTASPQVWVTSDIHIDYQENYQQLIKFAYRGHGQDALIIAGDASDRLTRLKDLFSVLVPNFQHVLFVPGNHELWIRRSDFADSVAKWQAIQSLCDSLGVQTGPVLFGQQRKVWLVPLLSWYDDKDQPEHSLYVEKSYAEDRTDQLWGDFRYTRWPDDLNAPLAEWFAVQNQAVVAARYDDPVMTFSHFLPRQELLFSKSLEQVKAMAPSADPMPEFNFSRVAGSRRIDQQLRQIGSQLHVYGHQHRNRLRIIDGVRYFSHCMGYPKERQSGWVADDAMTPVCVWREDLGFLV